MVLVMDGCGPDQGEVSRLKALTDPIPEMLERYWAFSERKKNQINGLIKEWHYLLRLRILKKEKDLFTYL